eukprot:1079244-Prymnesium_polylepis.1
MIGGGGHWRRIQIVVLVLIVVVVVTGRGSAVRGSVLGRWVSGRVVPFFSELYCVVCGGCDRVAGVVRSL